MNAIFVHNRRLLNNVLDSAQHILVPCCKERKKKEKKKTPRRSCPSSVLWTCFTLISTDNIPLLSAELKKSQKTRLPGEAHNLLQGGYQGCRRCLHCLRAFTFLSCLERRGSAETDLSDREKLGSLVKPIWTGKLVSLFSCHRNFYIFTFLYLEAETPKHEGACPPKSRCAPRRKTKNNKAER